MTEIHRKCMPGQDGNPFVVVNILFWCFDSNNTVDVIQYKTLKNSDDLKNSQTRKGLSCPEYRFSVIGRSRTGYKDKIENIISILS